MTSTNNTQEDDDDFKVVLEQTLLNVEEVFIYRVPPMMTSGGHRADDWDLAKPLSTCSLTALRRDSTLLLKILVDRPKPNAPPGATEKHLFAQSKISLTPNMKMEHWIEPVTDSSRYFVIRISDEKSGKEAHIGIGFRERNDALNFKMSLQDYENTMRKEALVVEKSSGGCHGNWENNNSGGGGIDGVNSPKGDSGESASIAAAEAVSKLSLKDGEKIHINFKGTGVGTGTPQKASSRKKSTTDGDANTSASDAKPPKILLRKPPPPGSSSSTRPTASRIMIDTTGVLKSPKSEDENTRSNFDASSIAAVTEQVDTMDEDDDDEWGDFESGPSSSTIDE